jgi:hypothetical protein
MNISDELYRYLVEGIARLTVRSYALDCLFPARGSNIMSVVELTPLFQHYNYNFNNK